MIILIALVIIFFLSEALQILNFDKIALSYNDLSNLIAKAPILSFFLAMLIYIIASATSFPLAWLLSISMGLFFGWEIGSLIVLFGATIGASALFLLARYAFADFFRARAGGFLNKMAHGLKENAISYLLFLRLVPLFPFTLVNIVPAIANVRFSSFVISTFFGIIPAVVAYTYAGEGLRSIVKGRALACETNIDPCGQPLKTDEIVTKEILIAFLLLGLVSLIPVIIKTMRPKQTDKNDKG